MSLTTLVACASAPPAIVVNRLPAKNQTIGKPTLEHKTTANKIIYKEGDWRPETYIVKKGDTLIGIGLEYGFDYKEIAEFNRINAPYNIYVGQALKFAPSKDKNVTSTNISAIEDNVVITPINTQIEAMNANATVPMPSTSSTTSTVLVINEPKALRELYSDEAFKKPLPLAKTIAETFKNTTASNTTPSNTTTIDTGNNHVATVSLSTNKATIDPSTINQSSSSNKANVEVKPDVEVKTNAKPGVDLPDAIDWAWPTKGKVTGYFNESSNKGIDIAGASGQIINAASAGKVIYSGSDLRGYGKLVIIKHNNNYLSVYAHNSQINVKEGQQVTRGQKIAEMGSTDSESVKLHFEIRHQGKSVDPNKYLPNN